MTTKLEKAARQALEALERLPEMCGIEEAITALREALDHFRDATKKVAEQAEQEPAACIIHTKEGDYVDWNSKGYCFYVDETPLYAAPVRTKDLTEYELDELRFQNLNYLDYARAVIAADREKNK